MVTIFLQWLKYRFNGYIFATMGRVQYCYNGYNIATMVTMGVVLQEHASNFKKKYNKRK